MTLPPEFRNEGDVRARLELKASDGSCDQTKSVPDEAVEGEGGVLKVEFTKITPGKQYTCRLFFKEASNDAAKVVFEGIES